MRRLLKLLAALAALIAAASFVPPAQSSLPHYKGCNTRACDVRVYRKHRLKVIHPYVAWLERTGACESGTDYNLAHGLRVVSPTGAYRGRYQFSLSTWHAAGGEGDPIDASWLEQAYRAVLWRKRIGNPHQTAGWPVCG